MPAFVELGEKGPPEFLKSPIIGPTPETIMDGALLAVSFWQFAPLCACPKNPENALEALAIVGGRPTTLWPAFAVRKFLPDQFPLSIRKLPPCHRPVLLALESVARKKYLLFTKSTRVFGWLLV